MFQAKSSFVCQRRNHILVQNVKLRNVSSPGNFVCQNLSEAAPDGRSTNICRLLDLINGNHRQFTLVRRNVRLSDAQKKTPARQRNVTPRTTLRFGERSFLVVAVCICLACTVGLPLTIIHLFGRTRPSEDDDLPDEFDDMAKGLAKLLGIKTRRR